MDDIMASQSARVPEPQAWSWFGAGRRHVGMATGSWRQQAHRSCAVVLAKRSMRQGPPRMPPPSASGTATRIHHADRSTTTPSTEESSARHHVPAAIRRPQQAAGSEASLPYPLTAQPRKPSRRAQLSAMHAGDLCEA